MPDLVPVWSNYYITDRGLIQKQKAIAEGLRIFFTKAEIGQGVPVDPADIWTIPALISFSKQVGVKRSYEKDTTHHLIVHIDNTDYEEEIFMREIGIYSQLLDLEGNEVSAEVLYGYSYTEHGYEAIPAGNAFHRIWDISADTGISRASEVKILYDGSVVYASQNDLDERILPLTPDTELITFRHGLGCYPVPVAASLKWGGGMGAAGNHPAGGTAPHSVPVQWEWLSRDEITLFVPQTVAKLGTVPQIRALNDREYIVVFTDNIDDSIYIQLLEGAGAIA